MPLDNSTPFYTDEEDRDLNTREIIRSQIQLLRWIRSSNLINEPDFDKTQLGQIGQKVKREYDIDYNSCNEWRQQYEEHLEFALQIAEEKTYPWPGASNIIYPLLTVAALQFAARAYPAIVNGPNVVKGVVIGDDNGVPYVDPQTGQPAVGPQGPVFIVPPGIKQARATNVADHMSWQLLYEQEDWEANTDTLLHVLPIVGCCFRKSYFDPTLGHNTSYLVYANKLVVNYHAKSFEKAPRKTEEIPLYPYEIEERIRAGMFVGTIKDYPQDSSERNSTPGDEDSTRMFLEQHRRLDLDGDGYAEPYIVTIHKQTCKVARIVTGYDSDGVMYDNKTHKIVRIEQTKYYTEYNFLPPLPNKNGEGGGVYGTGLGRLLSPINAGINTTLNQLIDAGHLQIRGGGFIGKSLSMNTGNVRFAMGEYKSVNVSGATLRDNLIPLTFPGPNLVLFQLLGLLIESGKEVASIKDVLSGDINQANVPATTTISLIEQGLKVFLSIYKRIYRSLKKEFELLYRLNSIYLPEEMNFNKGEEFRKIQRQDYSRKSGIEPVADPSMVTDIQKFAYAQFLLQFAGNPSFNSQEIFKTVFDYVRVPQSEKFIVPNPPPNPAILAKISEVASATARDRAAETRDLAQSILYLAQARKVSDDAHLAWFDQQLELFRAQLEHATTNQPQGGDQTGQGPGQPGQPQGQPPVPNGPQSFAPLSPLAMTLAQESGLNLPQLPQLPHNPPMYSGAPPSIMARAGPGGQLPANVRLARDGNYYIPNPRNPGKYLMLVRH